MYRSGRAPEALTVLEALPAAELEKPAVANYYGIVLSANHQGEKARRYLELGKEAPLLPEETALVSKAIATIPPRSEKAP